MKITREGVYKIRVSNGNVDQYPIRFMHEEFGCFFDMTRTFIPESKWVNCEVIERIGDIKQ